MEAKQLAHDCLKAAERTMRTAIPLETCPLRKQKAEWKKQQVVTELIKILATKYKIEPDTIHTEL